MHGRYRATLSESKHSQVQRIVLFCDNLYFDNESLLDNNRHTQTYIITCLVVILQYADLYFNSSDNIITFF